MGLSYGAVSFLFTPVWLLISNLLLTFKGELSTLVFKMIIDIIFDSMHIDLLIGNVISYGLILATIVGATGNSESLNIKMIEATKWDWQEGKKGFTTGANFVTSSALVITASCLTIRLFILLLTNLTGLNQEMTRIGMTLTIPNFILFILMNILVGIFFGLIFGFVFAPLGGLIGSLKGLRGLELEKRTSPNQGVWRSATNAVFYGLTFGVIGGLTGGMVIGALLGTISRVIVLTELAGEQSLRVTDGTKSNLFRNNINNSFMGTASWTSCWTEARWCSLYSALFSPLNPFSQWLCSLELCSIPQLLY